MGDEIEYPVTEHRRRRNPRCAAIAPNHEIHDPDKSRPPQHSQKAVGNGIVAKIEWRNLGDAGRDSHVLNPQQEKDRPQEIEKFRGQYKGAERALGSRPFGREGNTKMAYEHEGQGSTEVMARGRGGLKQRLLEPISWLGIAR